MAKRVAKPRKGSKKSAKPIEYITVPKHWFLEPMHHAMTTVVRPPTKGTRRKEQSINLKIPSQIFVDLMQPMDTGDMAGFEWEDEAKTSLKPTKETKAYQEFKYTIAKPVLMVDKFWCLETKERMRRVRKEGQLTTRRRGLGSSRLHLSNAAEDRGQRTDLLAQVTGNVTVKLKVPKKEKSMPSLQINVKVSTLSQTGHIEWATTFAPRTAAALRKQMQTHLRAMIDNPEYPTLSGSQGLLTLATDSVRPDPPAPPLALTMRAVASAE